MTSVAESGNIGVSDSKKRMVQLLRKMGKFEAPRPKESRLQLLDLPIDVLKVIISEINHTNDLTALALTHSALHDLVIPQMYSRFDIVWPENSASSDNRVGVDALAYGLSTLVMGEGVFDAQERNRENGKGICGCNCGKEVPSNQTSTARRRRKGNDYAQYTRKFSLGNGHPSMINDYLITRESGKMLGTLASLAITRMINLETFTWDMPTGVVQDVFEALASLSRRADGGSCRLSNVWVRFHDSVLTQRSYPTRPAGRSHRPNGNNVQHYASLMVPGPLRNEHYIPKAQLHPSTLTTPSASLEALRHSYIQTEHPNFSILPPVKILTALDIDQIAHVEELSILVEKSLRTLSQFRMSMATTQNEYSRGVFTGLDTSQISQEIGTSYAGAGGVLGMVMSKFYDCRRQLPREHGKRRSPPEPAGFASEAGEFGIVTSDASERSPMAIEKYTSSIFGRMERVTPEAKLMQNLFDRNNNTDSPMKEDGSSRNTSLQDIPTGRKSSSAQKEHRNYGKPTERRKLHLSVLELGHLTLTTRVLCRAIDLKFLTSLTLLYCNGDDDFWKTLRKQYPPRPSHIEQPYTSKSRAMDYPLKLKRIHTNSVTQSLISFLKENLAPDSLESLFLQDRYLYSPSSEIDLDKIYRGPLRRHRNSLRKLCIDSEDKLNRRSTSWKRWIVSGEALRFIGSGKMPKMRELSLSLDYRDWHAFLQSLPNLPHLRSLYIPRMKNLGSVRFPVARTKEFALQILDIVALRPEIELCYIGLLDKCFEVMESSGKDDNAVSVDADTWWVPGMDDSETEDEEDDDGEEPDSDWPPEGEHDDSMDEGSGGNGADDAGDADTVSDDSISDADEGPKKPQLKLREILFYAERVEIFKIRNSKL